jgi:hypothetical protein
MAFRKAGVPMEPRIYAQGRHGVALAPDDPAWSCWPKQLADRFRVRGLLPKNPPTEEARRKHSSATGTWRAVVLEIRPRARLHTPPGGAAARGG